MSEIGIANHVVMGVTRLALLGSLPLLRTLLKEFRLTPTSSRFILLTQ